MLDTIDSPITPFKVRSRDGTWIQAYTCGTGPCRWLLPPGMGTPLLAWRYLLERFAGPMTIATWELRGCYRSERPADPRRMEVEDHVDDAEAVLDALEWEAYATGGWSMGVQLGLELYRRRAAQVEGLVLINGAFEHVLKTAFGVPGGEATLVAAAQALAAVGPFITVLSRLLLSLPVTPWVLRRLRLVAENDLFFTEVVQEFKHLDFSTFLPMVLPLNRHSARGVLPDVTVPTLITAGGADVMTPPSVAKELHGLIGGSELFVVPEGTHYTTLEYPERVNARLAQFFNERVWPQRWSGGV